MSAYNPGSGFTKTSPWNPSRIHPVTGKVKPHRGEDWAASKGTHIPSAADGTVVYNGDLAGYGNVIVLEHNINNQTVHTLYAHMNEPSPLPVGAQVVAQQTVGNVGHTGIGTGDHLHFEVMLGRTPGVPDLRKGHSTVDPRTFDFSDGGTGAGKTTPRRDPQVLAPSPRGQLIASAPTPHVQLLSAFLAHWSQQDRLLRLTLPLGLIGGLMDADTLLVEGFTGHEALDENYRLEVTALSTHAHLPLTALLGQPVLLELLTSASRTELRPFHGHITHIEAVGANGGLARYTLIIEPWTTFLTLNRDSALYQDMTVFAIFDTLFKRYVGQGALAPDWRLELADPSMYPPRSLTTQYQESDWAFIERLMDEEGLFYYYEHHGDADSPACGRHTLVIADHNGAFTPNLQPDIDFTQPGAVMKRDSIDRWRRAQHWHTNSVEQRSWDYRSLSPRPVAAQGMAPPPQGLALIHYDTPGAYAYPLTAHGQRRADRRMEALEAHHARLIGAGTVRTLAPGVTFILNGHADALSHIQNGGVSGGGDHTFTVLRVVHRAYNNLRADLQSQLGVRLGALALPDSADDAPHSAVDTDHGPRPLYRNRLDALPGALPYRPLHTNAHGVPRLWRHPKPRITGQQTAIVVGSGIGQGDQVIHTDRDHRIKVQFHWQRDSGDQRGSHSRLTHPHATRDDHTGAPADHTSGTWVRLAATLAPIAGANWGSHAIPRIGQEVFIDFAEDDIDRPVVRGSVYNGRGATDAQYNQVNHGAGSATGNAPAWFPGTQGAHAHPAVLSGIKTQALSSSQAGGGAYNQLVFDDSPDQGRTVLQHHAQPHQGAAELNLGHLRHTADNQHLHPVGVGAEIKTPHSVALRAGQGLLLSTDARPQARSTQLDSREAQAQLESSHHLQTRLASTAQQHHAKLQGEPTPDKLPALAQTQHSLDVIQATATAGDDTEVTAYSAPHLLLSGAAGIAATSAASVILCAGNTSSFSAQDINLTAQGNSHHAVKAGISVFTYGKVSNKNNPDHTTGIALHAASGKVTSQSQSDKTRLTADKTLTLASHTQSLTLAAKLHLLLTAQGACVKLHGGNIDLHAPGGVSLNATLRKVGPGAGSSMAGVNLPKAGGLSVNAPTLPGRFDEQFRLKNNLTGEPFAFVPYRIEMADGTVLRGLTDSAGKAQRIHAAQAQQGKLFFDGAAPDLPKASSLTLSKHQTPQAQPKEKLDKKITQIYWTYGDDEIPLTSQSRFYTDLNLHVKTENYEAGEMVEVVIQNGKNVAEEIKTLNFSVSINADGTGKLKNVFKNESLDISSHC